MRQQARKAPKRRDDRIILHFDYDCFYAQVVENRDPSLKSRPLGIRQKNILATSNYNARRRGVRKLMLVSEATTLCPDLVLVDGEDLTPFRDVSKRLYAFLRAHSWNNKAERLGFDEVFMDITDIVNYNASCINRASLSESFFCLSQKEPERGFRCDLTAIAGCTVGSAPPSAALQDYTHLRLLLASHLAQYLRLHLEIDFGYTSTCGIATNKLLSKLVGGCSKPRNQTTLLALTAADATSFVDGHELGQLPGLGSRTVRLLESRVLGHSRVAALVAPDSSLTVGHVRQSPLISSASLESLLAGPGAERGVDSRIWGLLHGVDAAQVKEASDIPSQISVEDTYKGLETMAQITEELHKLSCSLIRRMRADLVGGEGKAGLADAQRWVARPKTLRLSIRSWPSRHASTPGRDQRWSHDFGRISRSGPLPNFVFDFKASVADLAQQLTTETVLPLLRRLQGDKRHGWRLQPLNICAANMVMGAADNRTGAGRDIGDMFRRQDAVLQPWNMSRESDAEADDNPDEATSEEAEMDPCWDNTAHPACPTCGHFVPRFAMAAHTRYHELGE